MRGKRWLTPPSSRPPERCLRPRLPPPPPPSSLSPPPSIVSARRHALRTAQKLPTTRVDPYQILGKVLRDLPPISQQPQTSIRLREQLEQEVGSWRRACAVAHAALYGPIRFHRRKFRNSVVRIVGHTMRLLLRLGHIERARELDRAFFSRVGTQGSQVYNLQEPLPILEEESEGTSNEGEGDGKRKTRGFKAKRYQLGKWLGLERGPIRIAWMQSLAVRLHGETLNNFQAEEFGQFIAEMLELHRSQPFDPLILAFVVRKLELVHVQLEGEGLKRKGARRQVRKLIKAVKQAESEGQEKVSIALLDGAIDKLEKQLSGEVDMVLYGQVEKQLETLVGTLDGPLSQHFQAYSELHQHVPDVESIDRHAHVLYLAIRFLLFRIRHSIVSSRTSSSFNRTNTLYSVSQLYTLLLDLSTAVVSSTLELSRLRQRQSSALYRILWAHLGVYDTRNTALQTLETLSSSEDTKAALPRHDPSLVAAAYDLIDLTLESTANLRPPVDGSVLPSHLPHDTRLIGVSTRFHRHALYLLSLPFAPSRRDLGSVSPSWCTFQRVLNSIERQRLHDSQCLRHKTFRYSRQEWEQDLVVQPAFAIHLLRATLLGSDSSPSTLPSRPSTEEGTPMSRLRELFDLMTKLEESCDMAGRDREAERKARKYFRKAVKVVVEEEWKGEGTRVWKDLIKKKVKDWATEKYRKPLAQT